MRKIWMVAAATTTVFMLSAQDGSVETQGIGVIIDAHALVDVVNDEIVFDFSNDDPMEAGDALHHTMGIGFWRLLGSIKNPALGRVLKGIQR